MSIQQVMLGLGGAFPVDSADFDGTNDYMTRGAGLTGAADSKTGVLSVWARIDGASASFETIIKGGSGLETWRIGFAGVAGTFEVRLLNAANTTILQINTSTSFSADGVWRNFLTSWDLLNNVSHIYVNDVSDQSVTTRTNDTIDYTKDDWGIGAFVFGPGSGKFNGCLAELAFYPGQYLDFSVTANRRKFISGALKPVSLGADGSLPGIGQPILYHRVAKGAAASTFATNLGSGGNFTITGTLDVGSTSP